jgi:hypothetical protein
MAKPLSLVQARQDQAERLRKIRIALTDEGVEGLTTEELRALPQLEWLEKNGELEPNRGENELISLASQRIEAAKKRIAEGEPPFDPGLRPWKWDKKGQFFLWVGEKKPKDYAGDPHLIEAELELERFNPFPGEAEPGRKL